jgi:hypothetical protein
MFDVLLCYGFTANMIRAGYVGLVSDLIRQAWASCRQVAAAAIGRRPSRGSATRLRHAGEIARRRLTRLETYVTSMT